MAEASGLTQTAVSRVWRAFALQPHRTETFKLAKDPQFIEKVRDVVGLYMNPPTRALVLCVDEKSQIQALDRTQPIFPMGPEIWHFLCHHSRVCDVARDVAPLITNHVRLRRAKGHALGAEACRSFLRLIAHDEVMTRMSNKRNL
jgi:hypothetical protein